VTIGFNEGIATRNIFAPSVLELVLNVASVAVVDRVVELVLGRTGNQFIGMAGNNPSLNSYEGA